MTERNQIRLIWKRLCYYGNLDDANSAAWIILGIKIPFGWYKMKDVFVVIVISFSFSLLNFHSDNFFKSYTLITMK